MRSGDGGVVPDGLGGVGVGGGWGVMGAVDLEVGVVSVCYDEEAWSGVCIDWTVTGLNS